MREQHQKELSELKQKLEAVERFAEKVPILADKIFTNKYTGDEQYINFSYISKYQGIKDLWRNNFKEIELYNPSKIVYNKVLYRIYFYREYVPTVNNNYGLDELSNDKTVFHFDYGNNVFYIEEENLEAFLNKFDVWYKQMLIKSKIDKANVEIKAWEKIKKDNERLLKGAEQ